jgi:hypothetical protein
LAALRLLAPGEAASEVVKALAWIERRGGMEAVADPQRCALHVLCLQFLALAGLYDERAIKRMPAVVALLPRKLRQKVSFVVPVTLSWSVMQRHTWPLKGLVKQVFKLAEPRAGAYFDELVQFSGPAGGIQESPLLVSMMCFALARAGVRRDLVDQLAGYLRLTVREDGSWAVNRDLEFSVTTFVTMGLQEAGYTEDTRLNRALTWIRGCQHDRAFPPTGCPPGGWAWSIDSGWPNCDDTADALMTLAGFGLHGGDGQCADGLAWLLRMQNRGRRQADRQSGALVRRGAAGRRLAGLPVVSRVDRRHGERPGRPRRARPARFRHGAPGPALAAGESESGRWLGRWAGRRVVGRGDLMGADGADEQRGRAAGEGCAGRGPLAGGAPAAGRALEADVARSLLPGSLVPRRSAGFGVHTAGARAVSARR